MQAVCLSPPQLRYFVWKLPGISTNLHSKSLGANAASLNLRFSRLVNYPILQMRSKPVEGLEHNYWKNKFSKIRRLITVPQEHKRKKMQMVWWLSVKWKSFLSICSKWNEKTEYVFITSNLENSSVVSSNINHMLTIQPNQSWIFTQNKQKHMSTEELEDEGSQWLYL